MKPSEIVNFFEYMCVLFPKANPPKRLVLNYAFDEQFRTLIDQYLRRGLSKGKGFTKTQKATLMTKERILLIVPELPKTAVICWPKSAVLNSTWLICEIHTRTVHFHLVTYLIRSHTWFATGLNVQGNQNAIHDFFKVLSSLLALQALFGKLDPKQLFTKTYVLKELKRHVALISQTTM